MHNLLTRLAAAIAITAAPAAGGAWTGHALIRQPAAMSAPHVAQVLTSYPEGSLASQCYLGTPTVYVSATGFPERAVSPRGSQNRATVITTQNGQTTAPIVFFPGTGTTFPVVVTGPAIDVTVSWPARAATAQAPAVVAGSATWAAVPQPACGA